MPAVSLARAYALAGDRSKAEAALREMLVAPTRARPVRLRTASTSRLAIRSARIDWIERGSRRARRRSVVSGGEPAVRPAAGAPALPGDPADDGLSA